MFVPPLSLSCRFSRTDVQLEDRALAPRHQSKFCANANFFPQATEMIGVAFALFVQGWQLGAWQDEAALPETRPRQKLELIFAFAQIRVKIND
jgi:hypothetical protein